MKEERDEMASQTDPELDQELKIEGMSPMILETLVGAGYDTLRKLLSATSQELPTIPEISQDMADDILEQIRKKRT